VALGLLHGPTELLPLSSSGHTTLVPWLAGWPYGELQPELRKSFEVALHAGTAAALIARPPWQGPSWSPHGHEAAARLGFGLVAVAPPALAGYALGTDIERHLGRPATIAAALLAGSGAMIATGRRADGTRRAASAGARDGLALGVAQSLALVPGLSRSAITLAAGRARGFSRADSDRLSWEVGLPVIGGAALLKGTRLARAGVARELRGPLAAGAASAFLSALLSARLLTPERRIALLPACIAYRTALALLAIRRMRDNNSKHAPISKKIKTSHNPVIGKGILGRSRHEP
jgi:undecaprenyl-diphosphatase